MKQYECTHVNVAVEAIVNKTTGATGRQTTHNSAKESDGAKIGLSSTTPKLWTIHFSQMFRIHTVCWTTNSLFKVKLLIIFPYHRGSENDNLHEHYKS